MRGLVRSAWNEGHTSGPWRSRMFVSIRLGFTCRVTASHPGLSKANARPQLMRVVAVVQLCVGSFVAYALARGKRRRGIGETDRTD